MRRVTRFRTLTAVTALGLGLVVLGAVPASADTVVDTYTGAGGSTVRTNVIVSPDGQRVYTADSTANTVTVLDAGDGTVIDTVPLTGSVASITLSPDGATLYAGVSVAGVAVITPIDTAALTAGTPVSVPEGPTVVQVSPDGSRLYVANGNSDSVTVLATSDLSTVATIPMPTLQPRYISFTPDSTRAYISHWSGVTASPITVIDVATSTVIGAVTTAAPSTRVSGLAMSADGTRLYAVRIQHDSVDVIDTATNTIIDAIAVGDAPGGIDLHSDGRRAYVTSSTGDGVSIIDLAAGSVSQTVPVGDNPQDVAISPDGAFAYVTNATPRTVSVVAIDAWPAIPTTALPNGAVDGADYTATVAVTGTPLPTLAVTSGTLPPGLAFDPATGILSGTPTTPGTYTFTVTATSTVSGIPSSVSREYTVVIEAALAATGRADAYPLVLGGLASAAIGVLLLAATRRRRRAGGVW